MYSSYMFVRSKIYHIIPEKSHRIQVILKDEYSLRLKELKEAKEAKKANLYSEERRSAVSERVFVSLGKYWSQLLETLTMIARFSTRSVAGKHAGEADPGPESDT